MADSLATDDPWRNRTVIIKEWDDFATNIGGWGSVQDWGCRGESRWYGSLHPTLDRDAKAVERLPEFQLAIERQTMREFRLKVAIYLTPVEREFLDDAANTMILMRHYGAPTRLVDWSASPWIGLHFACAGHPEEPGFLKVFNLQRLQRRAHELWGTETSLCSRAFAVGSNEFPMLFHPAVSSKLHEWAVPLFSERSQFARLTAQQGFFTIASRPQVDHWKAVTTTLDNNSDYCHIFEIPALNKPDFLRRLHQMGISDATLYPGPDGVGRSLRAFCQFGSLLPSVNLDHNSAAEWAAPKN